MSIMSSGLILMVIGMTTVFVFLCLLIGTMYGLGWATNRFFPEKAAAPDSAMIAAISAAVHSFIRSKK